MYLINILYFFILKIFLSHTIIILIILNLKNDIIIFLINIKHINESSFQQFDDDGHTIRKVNIVPTVYIICDTTPSASALME